MALASTVLPLALVALVRLWRAPRASPDPLVEPLIAPTDVAAYMVEQYFANPTGSNGRRFTDCIAGQP